MGLGIPLIVHGHCHGLLRAPARCIFGLILSRAAFSFHPIDSMSVLGDVSKASFLVAALREADCGVGF